MSRIVAALVVAALGFAPAPARAEERPETKHLVLAGAGMAIPTYWLGVILHEGSHAVLARSFGAKITKFQILPGRHPKTGVFYFGYTGWRGRMTRNEKVITWLAPKFTDAILLGGYAALHATGNLPENRYGQLSLAVLATGAWVDFGKDFFLWWKPSNDISRVFSAYDCRGLCSLPWRVFYASLGAASGYLVLRGYQKVFADDGEPGGAAFLLPLAQGRF